MGDTREIRLCHLIKWPDFNGYGFNLHAEKGKAGQYIGKVDENSPAELAKLQPGDRIVEVNGVNIGNENHQQVVSRIKAGGNETRMLVLSDEEEAYFKEKKIVVTGDLPSVKCYSTPVPRPAPGTEGASGVVEEEKLPVNGEVQKSSEPEVDESAAAVAVVTVTEVASEHAGYHSNTEAPAIVISQYNDDENLPETPSEPDETPVNEDDTPASTEAPPSEPPQDEVIVATEETATHTEAPPYEPPQVEVAEAEDETPHEDEDDEPVYEQPDAPVPEPEPTVVVVPPPEFEPIVASEPPPPEPEPPKEPEPEPPKEPEPEPPKEPEPEPPKEPEPVPAPEPAKEPEPTPPPAEPVSQPPAQPTNGVDGGLNLNISAKEMRERLSSKKKADPRLKGGSFQHKYDVFQRM